MNRALLFLGTSCLVVSTAIFLQLIASAPVPPGAPGPSSLPSLFVILLPIFGGFVVAASPLLSLIWSRYWYCWIAPAGIIATLLGAYGLSDFVTSFQIGTPAGTGPFFGVIFLYVIGALLTLVGAYPGATPRLLSIPHAA